MDETAVRGLLGLAGTMAAPGSLLGLDLVNRNLLDSPATWPLLAAFARRGATGRFGTNDPEGLLAEHGWAAEATQAGEWGANYGRWSYPVPLRGRTVVPRIFFVRGWRDPSLQP